MFQRVIRMGAWESDRIQTGSNHLASSHIPPPLLPRSHNPLVDCVRSQEGNQSVSQMSSEDRAQLLYHLKQKWGRVNHAYQGFSLAVDTEMKKHRKEGLEAQLAEIERDIKTLERGDVVFVMEE